MKEQKDRSLNKNAQTAINMHRGRHRFHGPVEKAKDQKGTLKRIWGYLQKQRKAMVLASFLVLLSTGAGLAGPYLIGIIVDHYIIPQDISGTIVMAAILGAVYILYAFLTWLQSYIMIHASQVTIKNLREDLFGKLQTLSLPFFDRKTHGELMSRVTNDVEQLNNALSQSVIQILSALLTLAGAAIAMFSLNWIMAIVALMIIPLLIYATKLIIKYSTNFFIKRQRHIGELNGLMEESITGLEVISLFGKEEQVFRKFSVANERYKNSSMGADAISGSMGPVNNFINNLGLALIILSGALLTLKGMATVGIIAAFVTYSRQFYRPINQLSNLMNTVQAAVAGAERVFEVMDETPDIKDAKDALPVKRLNGSVEFSHVYFCYENNKPVLRDIQFSAKPGETIAIVGPTGSGKTTIVQLLSRFYDPVSGNIFIDGKNIKEYRIGDLRKRIGIVLQDPFLFSGTIMENIRYGRLDATDEEVVEAAKIASADPFIRHLPENYFTEITSGGDNLSQGQKQLLAIARAILADSDILILDEATSSIDTRTEKLIQQGFKRLMEGKTTFVIAHRLKTIENADQIIVIKDGEIIERGTHGQLLEKKGFYYQSYLSQFSLNGNLENQGKESSIL